MGTLLVNAAIWGTILVAGAGQTYFARRRRITLMRRFFPEEAEVTLQSGLRARGPKATWFLFEREVRVRFVTPLSKDPIAFEISLRLPNIDPKIRVLISGEEVDVDSPETERRLGENQALDRALAEIHLEDWKILEFGLQDSSLTIQGQASLHGKSVDFAPTTRGERIAALATALEWAIVRDENALPCPHCRVVPMNRRAGALLESACPRCQGRFLPPGAVQRLVADELGISQGELKDAATGKTKTPLDCPRCGSQMTPTLLGDVIADLCKGCGSLWLDKDELGLLSQGRYEEASPKEDLP
jgi:Zn-finger nucleic acid-binding protein